MAASSLLALIDDIATVLDDVAVLTKVAARKTAGVLGDDLALNAQQVAGVRAERELPVVWAVMRGSFWNKAILVPVALLLSAVAPWLVAPLLMVGGAFLCFEGFEKLWHKLMHRADADAHHAELTHALTQPDIDLVAFERDKIRGAVRTDFVLSAEIIAISLGTVAHQDLATRATVLVAIALVMTVGVYGLVAAIVKLDDAGLALTRTPAQAPAARARVALGQLLLNGAPWLMKALSVAGTVAMFLVGGGILVHGWPALHHIIEAGLEGLGGAWPVLLGMLADAAVGVVAGALVLAAVSAGTGVAAQLRR